MHSILSPDSPMLTIAHAACRDLYVGAVLDIHSRNFELVEADEFTLQYMESNRVIYPQADWQNAAGLIRDYLQGVPHTPT